MKQKVAIVLLALIMVVGVSIPLPARATETTASFPASFMEALDEALYDAFGTTDPFEIGEAPYARFITDFVEASNERIRIAIETGETVSPFMLQCPFCGGVTINQVWFHGWEFTGQTREAGTWPILFIEFEQQGIRVDDFFAPCLVGVLVHRGVSPAFRWVPTGP